MTEPAAGIESQTSPFVTPAGEGSAVWYLDALSQTKAPAAATGGRLGVTEQLLPEGSSPPLHIHHQDDEAWYVLEGAISYQIGEDTGTAAAGAFIWGPRGIPHTFRIDSSGARMLTLHLPGGFEDFFAAIGRPAPELTVPRRPDGPPDIVEIARIAANYGCELVGPPMPRPEEPSSASRAD